MNGKLHMKLGAFIGVSGGIAICTQIDQRSVPFYVVTASAFAAGAVIGSLAPDIDTPTSTISKWIPLLPSIVNKIFGHRGFIHSPFCILLLFLLFYLVKPARFLSLFFIGILTGYSMHLIQDSFTKGGIPWFYPFVHRKYPFGFFKSGSKIDALITDGLCVIWTLLLISFLVL